MKRILLALTVAALAVGFAGSALAANFEFHGDLNNRFGLYTDQAGFFTLDKSTAVLDDDDREETFASIKYRLWTEAATNDGNVKGVYAIELGAVRFGNSAKGGAFSGDGVNIETRWAYTDFQLPAAESKARVRIGLQPWAVNPYFWNETGTAVVYYDDNLTLGWARGGEGVTGPGESWGDSDIDSLYARYNHKTDNYKLGLFANYAWQGSQATNVDLKAATDLTQLDEADVKDLISLYEIKKLPEVEFDLITVGVDGKFTTPTDFGNAFINYDLIYQDGEIKSLALDGTTGQDIDVEGYLAHLDLGANVGKTRFTYTLVYASGDDNVADNDFEGFLSIDVDRADSIIFQEGGYTDDFYFTERPYIGPYGMVMNKLAVDHKASDKLKFGGAALLLQTAEDVKYVDDLGRAQDEDGLGVEVDAYVSYMLYPNVEFAVNAGYLFSGDAMDIYDYDGTAGATPVDGDADNDIFRSTARIRYKF